MSAQASTAKVPNFDPLARVYRWLEYLSFGPWLECCRFHYLPLCVHARRILILGDGDGRFTARVLAANPQARIDVIDVSASMLAMLRRRVKRKCMQAGARLQTIQADLRRFVPEDGNYDLVISHFFLDCLTDDEIENMMERMAPVLAPRAAWLVSEFSIPEKGWRRAWAQQLIRFLYFAFSKMTQLQVRQLPDYASTMRRHDFCRREQTLLLGGLLVTEIWVRNENAPQKADFYSSIETAKDGSLSQKRPF